MISKSFPDWSRKHLKGTGGATYSDCETYRYTLWREWDLIKPKLVFCGLNPSTATERVEDNTIRRIIDFADRWGYGGITMLNIFAIRSTDPKRLYKVGYPIGPDNDSMIEAELACARVFVAGWGNHGLHMNRGAEVLAMVKRAGVIPLCLGQNKKTGTPKHPLYLKNETRLTMLTA